MGITSTRTLQIGAAYLVAHLGLDGAKLEHHASYLQSYLKILKEDKTAIFTAARLASQAFDHIMNLTCEPADADMELELVAA